MLTFRCGHCGSFTKAPVDQDSPPFPTCAICAAPLDLEGRPQPTGEVELEMAIAAAPALVIVSYPGTSGHALEHETAFRYLAGERVGRAVFLEAVDGEREEGPPGCLAFYRGAAVPLESGSEKSASDLLHWFERVQAAAQASAA